MSKKYKLTWGNISPYGAKLYRIKALRDFGDVRKGELGGFIQSEENLSHEGNCWVYGDARVFGNARVFGDAQAFRNAEISGDAWVFGNATISGHARIYDICINSSNQYMGIDTRPHHITITYAYVRIGCRHFSLDELLLDDYSGLVAERELEAYDIAGTKIMIDVFLEGILEAMSREC